MRLRTADLRPFRLATFGVLVALLSAGTALRVFAHGGSYGGGPPPGIPLRPAKDPALGGGGGGRGGGGGGVNPGTGGVNPGTGGEVPPAPPRTGPHGGSYGGGQFRGPRDITPPTPSTPSSPATPSSPGGPSTPATPPKPNFPGAPSTPTGGSGPTSTPGLGAPTTPGLDISLPNDAWDHWWLANRPRYLELQAHRLALRGPETGEGNEPSPSIGVELRARIGALLHRVLAEDSKASVDEQSAALIAAAKLAWQPAETRALFVRLLRAPSQEVRETAALALGLLGDEGALPLLIAMLRDAELARSVCGKSSIDERTRAFAAYATALLVRRSEPERQPAAAKLAREHLLAMLDGSLAGRHELEAAAICALGVLPLGERDWMHVGPRLEQLWLDEARHPLVLAQVPTAAGRLAGAGVTERLAVLVEDPSSDWAMRDSAQLVTGAFCSGLQPLHRKRLSTALELARKRGQAPGERAFAILALARLEDAEALRDLAVEASSGPHLDRPWIALGLGLAARSGAARSADVSALCDALRQGYRRTKAAETRSAYAIALGLAGDAESAAMLRRDLATSGIARERGHLAVALGLLRDDESKVLLRESLQRATRDPEEVGEIAIGLTLLGDQDAVPHFLALLEKGHTTATLAPLAEALGRLGGAAAANALLALAEDPKRTDLLHAFAIVGLGLCVEEQALPWVAPFAADYNYLAAPVTLAGSKGLLSIL